MAGEHLRCLTVVACTCAVQSNLNEGVLIDGAVDGMAEILIVEGVLLVVDYHPVEGCAGLIDDCDIIVFLQPGQVVCLDLDNEVDLSALKGDCPGGTLRDDPPCHVLDLRIVAPVIMVGLKLSLIHI